MPSRLRLLALKNLDPLVYIGTNGFAIANQLEGVDSMKAVLDFLDISYGTIKHFAEISHGKAG